MMEEKVTLFNCPHCGKSIALAIVSYISKPMTPGVTDQAKLFVQVKNALSKWSNDLDVAEKDGTITVAPKGYLGKDVWQEINDVLKPFSSEWISAKKESRWIIKSQR